MSKHRNYLLTFPALTAVLAFSLGATTACQPNARSGNETVNRPVTNSGNTVNQPENAKADPDKAPVGSLATPTGAYIAAHAARQAKDINALKKVLSKDMLEFFSDIGKAENKTIDDELKELVETPQASTAEARNETITGDRATIEYLDEKGTWKPMDFVKENGEWKLTMPNAQPTVTQGLPKKQK